MQWSNSKPIEVFVVCGSIPYCTVVLDRRAIEEAKTARPVQMVSLEERARLLADLKDSYLGAFTPNAGTNFYGSTLAATLKTRFGLT